MSAITGTPAPAVECPDSDGEPTAVNTFQFMWIVAIQGNFDVLFRDRADVFVAGDHLIYPVEGDNTTRQAPDAVAAYYPDGRRFLTFVELGALEEQTRLKAERLAVRLRELGVDPDSV